MIVCLALGDLGGYNARPRGYQGWPFLMEKKGEPQKETKRFHENVGLIHPGKLTYPLKRDYFNRKYIFQPSIFRGHVSFGG